MVRVKWVLGNNSIFQNAPGEAPSCRSCIAGSKRAIRMSSSALTPKGSQPTAVGVSDPWYRSAFGPLMLDGMAESWGSIDESLNTDLDHIDAHCGNHGVLVDVDGALVVRTGILLLRAEQREIVRMSVHRDRRGVATRLLADLVLLRPSMEFIASWWRPIQGGRGAQNLYLASGFLVS